MRRAFLTLAALMAVGHGTGEAQETARARAREILPLPVFQEIEALAAEAEQQDVPAELLFGKALEGMAKRVPTEQIAPAVRAYTGRLHQARTAFGPGAVPAPLMVAGADALQRGVGVEALRRLGEGRNRSPMAVLVLADLVESGVSTERALTLVREATQRRAREQDMLGMAERVRRLMRQGYSAQEAAEQVRRALRRRRGGWVGPPVPPGSEPLTTERRRRRLSGGARS
jgi:uncharacterized protein YoaH (UPF0181 family)